MLSLSLLSPSFQRTLNPSKSNTNPDSISNTYLQIKDVVAYLRLLANPRDDSAFKRVANKPTRGIGDGAMAKLRDAVESVRPDGGCSMAEAVLLDGDPEFEQGQQGGSVLGSLDGRTAGLFRNFRDIMGGVRGAVARVGPAEAIDIVVEARATHRATHPPTLPLPTHPPISPPTKLPSLTYLSHIRIQQRTGLIHLIRKKAEEKAAGAKSKSKSRSRNDGSEDDDDPRTGLDNLEVLKQDAVRFFDERRAEAGGADNRIRGAGYPL